MSSPPLSDDERAVIAIFGAHIRRHQRSIMAVRDIFAGLPEERSQEVREGMQRLMQRGWMLPGASVHWDQNSDCVLMGEALRLALRQGDTEAS